MALITLYIFPSFILITVTFYILVRPSSDNGSSGADRRLAGKAELADWPTSDRNGGA